MKKYLLIGIPIVLVLLFGGIFLLRSISSPKEESEEIIPTPTVSLPTVSEKVKVDLIAKSNNQAVKLTISGYDENVESIEYELTYLTGTSLPRGVLGKINVAGDKEVIRDDIVLGTCSSGRCVYDTGVTEINLSLKFNSIDGTSSVFQKTYPL